MVILPSTVDFMMKSDRALSKTHYWILLLVHCLAGLQLLVLLIHTQRFDEFLAALKDRGELPLLTGFVLFLSGNCIWLLGIGFAVDAIVFYGLGRFPKRRRWFVIGWFSLVLIAIGVLSVLAITGLLVPVQKMANTI